MGVVLIPAVIQGPKDLTIFNIQFPRSNGCQPEDGGRERYGGSQRGLLRASSASDTCHFFPHFPEWGSVTCHNLHKSASCSVVSDSL